MCYKLVEVLVTYAAKLRNVQRNQIAMININIISIGVSRHFNV